MSRLLCLLIVSWILVCSAETNILSSHSARANTVGSPSNVAACNGEGDIIMKRTYEYHVTICGSNFGDDVSVEVVGGFKAEIIYAENDMLIVKLPANGAGQNLKLRLNQNDHHGVVAGITVTYPLPMVTGVVRDTNAKRAAPVAEHVIIYGLNFEEPSPLIRVTATIGGFPCFNLRHISDRELRCTVSGYGANHQVIVTVNGQSSIPPMNVVGASGVRFDFMNTATPGLDCSPPFGSADVLNPEYCNCWSGSAPADNLLSQECSMHAVCAGRMTTQPTVAQAAPTRPETLFKDDKLWIKQTQVIVKNRRDTIIQFVVPLLPSASPATAAGTIGASTCAYPGNLWAKKINNLDCVDEYYGALPWSQHELCAFVERTDAATMAGLTRVWVSNLVTSYTETFKNNDGSIYFRKISHAFLLTVSFVRQITVLTHTPVTVYIADEKAPTSIEIEIMGDALYDVASKQTIINFKTTMVWPYQINDLTLPGTWTKAIGNMEPGMITVNAILNPLQPGEMTCEQTQDTTCEQGWIMTIQTAGTPDTCDIHGHLEFTTFPLLCRDYTTIAGCEPVAGTPPSTNFTIAVGKTDLCDQNAKDSDASAGLALNIETYYDATHEIAQSVFQTGDMVFFTLDVVDPSSTIDQITFNMIRVYTAGNDALEHELYRVATPGDWPSAATTFLTAADFNITQEFRTPFLVPSAVGELHFNFRLNRKVLTAVIGALSTVTSDSMTEQLTVEATVDILYHGNQRRSFVATSNIPAMAHTQISFYDMADTEEELEPHANDANVESEKASLFASPASTVVASCAAVVAAAAVILA